MIQAVRGDITKIKVDAIVNAANSSLMGGGGVDGAIHRAGGRKILEECELIIESIGKCEPGNAVITTAGNLPAKFVIHTVGPVWNGGGHREKELLADCYRNSLKLSVENGCRTISFPNISTGVYRFPKDLAAGISIMTISEFLKEHNAMGLVNIVCFEEENFSYVHREIERIGRES